ncbi:hypothetical protein NCF85_16025 (plasmid) [Qipengyuania citrea]|uniref:Uncharacterized protein n=1 Tax=Qipengyuania citrea TaxID=225971 RepID=A0ABY4UBL9_9SPHN|nr:hypothetical protein [Qipengyuania citrea]USA62993.1 hypothetical protein NCF85_16025 [Qipengyuania citrea]
MASQHTFSDEGWHELQRAQFWHDEKFHREISRLNTQDRLKHMALHFAKYAGALQDSPNDDRRTGLIVDTFIIAVSTFNILNVAIAEKFQFPALDTNRDFKTRLSIAAGKMAAACEKLDHLEAFPFREVITNQTAEILASVLKESEQIDLDLRSAVASRLQEVKSKALFYADLIV